MKLNKQAKLLQKPPLSCERPSNALLRYAQSDPIPILRVTQTVRHGIGDRHTGTAAL